MKSVQINTSPEFENVFKKYPLPVRAKLLDLRSLIIETAHATEGIFEIEETLKWGEPSFLTKKGSTIRIDWKVKFPEQYAIYFKCTSLLIPAFKNVFGNLFTYEANRAIIFQLYGQIPKAELKKCITAALTYHRVKHLPDLGIEHY
jgi:hypothetical protein